MSDLIGALWSSGGDNLLCSQIRGVKLETSFNLEAFKMLHWTTKIRKVGGSRVITLPASLLEETQWKVGEELAVTVSDGSVELRSNRRLSLEELMAKVPGGGLPSIEELEGLSSPLESVGKEL